VYKVNTNLGLILLLHMVVAAHHLAGDYFWLLGNWWQQMENIQQELDLWVSASENLIRVIVIWW